MPKGSRRGKSQTKHRFLEHYSEADFTVDDYANSQSPGIKSGRVSKAVMNAFSIEAKQLVGQKGISSEVLAWYEQLSSDEEFSDAETNNNEEGEEIKEKKKEVSSRRRTKRRHGKPLVFDEHSSGAVYPFDLWVVIGDWIHPEDVLVFASICHSSHVVTHTARFWCSMYKRCYVPSSNLPPSLHPAAMTNIHGLCGKVIRSLFIMYEPFQHRVQTCVSFDKDPECLKGAMCSLMWYQKVKSYWHFFFKFSCHVYSRDVCPLAANRCRQSPKIEDMDIHYNPECGSRILQIITQNFIPIPPSVMGQVLAKTTLSVGHGMRYHKMKLTFTPQQYRSVNNALHSGTTVILDPVLNAYVLHWWDPKYPHQPT